jgi:hypothetical protein
LMKIERHARERAHARVGFDDRIGLQQNRHKPKQYNMPSKVPMYTRPLATDTPLK